MAEYTEMECSECGQRLRIPKCIGGLVMACPTCGKKYYSDFKVAGSNNDNRSVSQQVFELPYTLLDKLLRFFKGK